MIRAKFTFCWAVPLLAFAMGCSSAPVETPTGSVQSNNAISTESASTESCVTASNCHGALPDLCRVCANGGDGCAHWACVSGQCEINYCQ